MDGGFGSLLKLAKQFGLEVFGFYYSVYPGYVVDNADPDRNNRIRISVPTILQGNSKTMWASPKGQYHGSQLLPKEGDMVWVSFLHGRLLYPIWEHYMPLTGQKPEEFKTENYYAFKSPKGHSVIINDDDDIITVTHTSKATITIDNMGISLDAGMTDIFIHNDNGSISLTDSGIDIDSEGSINIGGSNSVLYSKIPNATQIQDVSEIGIAKKVKIG